MCTVYSWYTYTKGHTWPYRQCSTQYSHTSHSTQSYRHTSRSTGHFTKITQAILTFQFKPWNVHSCATCLLKCVSKSILNLYKVYQHVLLQGVWHTEKQNCDLNVTVQNWFGRSPCQGSILTVIVWLTETCRVLNRVYKATVLCAFDVLALQQGENPDYLHVHKNNTSFTCSMQLQFCHHNMPPDLANHSPQHCQC